MGRVERMSDREVTEADIDVHLARKNPGGSA